VLVLFVFAVQTWEAEVRLLSIAVVDCLVAPETSFSFTHFILHHFFFSLCQIHEVTVNVRVFFKGHQLSVLIPPDTDRLLWCVWSKMVSSTPLSSVVEVRT